MRLGAILANVLAVFLFASLVGGIFLLFGSPLFPQRHAKMVLLSYRHAMTTASFRRVCSPKACLPGSFDLKVVRKRPVAP